MTIDRTPQHRSVEYERIEGLITAKRCVILDGGVATEIERVREGKLPAASKQLWGTWALYQAPQDVLEVHRRYLEVGCDVISTNTWSILTAPEMELSAASSRAGATHWMSVARLGIRLAQQAVAESSVGRHSAVAFTISEEVTNPERQRTVELLTRVFEEDRPDLILMETLALIRDLTFPAIQTLLDTGIPVWLSFRRCLHGPCGVYGQHWGGPEGDAFLRAARRFEEIGVGALLINCLPVDHVPGMISALRDFTDLPLGVYPNLGHLGANGWNADDRIGPDEFAALAVEWRKEGADIIGGCCGVTPDHIAAVRSAVVEDPPPRSATTLLRREASVAHLEPPSALQPWRDDRGQILYPAPFPEITLDPGVFVPTQGSLLVWHHLFRSGVGAGKRCLDVGCGSGILAIQLAQNGAEHVHAIDVDRRAVINTMTNAFRSGLSDQITTAEVDLYVWEPAERYDLIVASLYQMPVDPYEEYSGHRPLDFWGRNVFDHFLRLLPRALADAGVAYVMQLSIISQHQTLELLQEEGLEASVVDFRIFPFPSAFERNEKQIERVEQLSDAYHLRVGDEELVVAYLLEVTRRSP